jgi:hypothetical protein
LAGVGGDWPIRRSILAIDNQPAISLACGPAAHHQRTKHIASKYHFQRKLLLDGVVRYQPRACDSDSVRAQDAGAVGVAELTGCVSRVHLSARFGILIA